MKFMEGLDDNQFKDFLKKKGISFAGFMAKANEAKKKLKDKKECRQAYEDTRDLIEKLRLENFGLLDYCLIEQQVNRNTQMKVLGICQSY